MVVSPLAAAYEYAQRSFREMSRALTRVFGLAIALWLRTVADRSTDPDNDNRCGNIGLVAVIRPVRRGRVGLTTEPSLPALVRFASTSVSRPDVA